MLYFWNDYQEGAHPEVLRRLIDTNFEPLPGYGEDKYSKSAAEKIREASRAKRQIDSMDRALDLWKIMSLPFLS